MVVPVEDLAKVVASVEVQEVVLERVVELEEALEVDLVEDSGVVPDLVVELVTINFLL